MKTKQTEYKSYTPQLKIDTNGEGTFEAVFATMNVIDKDGDMTLNGAFGEQKVKISQYNHGSWSDGVNALPIGVGKIFERGDDAIVQGELNLDSTAGLETYKTLKFIAEKGHSQEWSYALPFIDYEYRNQEDGKRVRVLKKIMVPEVSPVLMGAGNDTRMLNIKSGDKPDDEEKETEEAAKGQTFAEQAETTLDAVKSLVKRYLEIVALREVAGTKVSKSSTDMLLRIKDNIEPVMIELDKIEKSCNTDTSDYLMLKKLQELYNGN